VTIPTKTLTAGQPWGEVCSNGANRKTKKGGNGPCVVKATERQIERKRPAPPVDAEVRSWIDHVLVPAMVDEWLAEHNGANRVAGRLQAVAQSERNSSLSAEGIQ
jgi:hypothetical protein